MPVFFFCFLSKIMSWSTKSTAFRRCDETDEDEELRECMFASHPRTRDIFQVAVPTNLPMPIQIENKLTKNGKKINS
ncbi:hypothetical protein X798_00961 [Onchocerca flexuosa]|uniref:Secreted protein n=1 Tax=Onchocerca flexuosa TaxID=387005 RepID=A0A238C2T5_9BILA|nr:hypothetical protein X798_00961 [Onchocerca flexuosa]